MKRGLALANPLSSDEAYLLEITLEVVALAANIWAEFEKGIGDLSVASAERLGRCAKIGTHARITQLQERYVQKQRLDANKQRRKKKPTKPLQQPSQQADSNPFY